MIDTNKALVKILQGNGPLLTLVPASRIMAGTLQEGTEFPAISFSTVGGTTDLHLPVLNPRVQIRCWHDTDPEVARQVYGAVHDALYGLRNQTLSGAEFLVETEEVVQGQDVVDPQSGYKSVLSFWRLSFHKDNT